jgi:meiotically up-regulated gene 157 (Mug157) protein
MDLTNWESAGAGNAVKGGTGLIKSAFRASDDATVFPFHIPSNAFIAVELARTAEVIQAIDSELADECSSLSRRITHGIYTHGVVNHALYGKVFAYEVDGYGSHLITDDASPPSLLSLPYLGFIDASDELYQSTRQMILSREGNPYYVVGSELEGQGSPHIDLKTMWPIGTIMQILTSNNDDEIRLCLGMLKKSSAGLGLMHEGVDVNDCTKFLRTWYAWGNSAFGEAIIDLGKRKPDILFGSGGKEKDNTVLKL